MKQRKPIPRLLCYASVFALSLTACSQHSGKIKAEASLNENEAETSTSATKKSRIFHISRNGFRKLQSAKKLGGHLGGKGYDNLWERLFDLYDLPSIEHDDIDRELGWFVNHPDYIDRVQTRAEPFLYNIVKHIEKQGVPGEIALLPVIESAFQPTAQSPARASGLWQFIPETGRRYGLKQNRSYDGRRDVYASTRAAIKYLKKLHDEFDGDWLLAVAAYNCGEGAVSRAIQKNSARNLPTDFWSLDLPQETRSYVPRLLAVAKLFADSDHYGIDLHPIPNQALFKTVKVKSPLDLALAADVADIPLDKLYELNPGLKSQHVDVDGGYRLFVPANKYREFKQELSRISEESSLGGRGKLADAVDDALQADGLASRDDGQVSSSRRDADTDDRPRHSTDRHADESARFAKRDHFRSAAKDDARVVERLRSNESIDVAQDLRDKNGKKSSYTVEKGDTLFSIARENGIDVDQLKKWNHLSGKGGIKQGQTLVVWSKDAGKKLSMASAGIKPSQSLKYTVRAGDSLFGISKRFGVSVADLRKWNGVKLDKQFKPGMNLTISGN